MIEQITNYQLKLPFSKGLIADYGVQLIPEQYSPAIMNMRIQNQVSIPRLGFQRVSESSTGTYIRGLVENGGLYAVYDSKFWEINVSTGVATQRGVLSGDYDVNFVVYGVYIIILTGLGLPYVYDTDTNTFTQPASITPGANPSMGVAFAYLTMVAGTNPANGKKNSLYISEGITAAAPQNAYDWIGGGADVIDMQSDILGIASTLNRVFIRTDKTIEYLDKSSLTTVGSTLAFTTAPLAAENQPASQRSIVVADDAVFFLTRNKHIKSLGYTPGIVEAEVGELSNRKGQSVQQFLDALDDDQSKSFGYFNRDKQTVERHMKAKGEPYNNVVLVYDLINDTFLPDNNKFFSCGVESGDKHYVGSMINPIIYEDDVGHDDDGLAIAWSRATPLLSLGDPTQRKQVRVIGLSGERTKLSRINMQVYADFQSNFFGTIVGQDTGLAGIGASPIGALPIAGNDVLDPRTTFERVVSRGELRVKCKKIQIVFSGNSLGEDLCLSALSIGFRGIGDSPIADKTFSYNN